MLCQTVDLFQALGWVGLRPENIFALGKTYSNRISPDAQRFIYDTWLRAMKNRGVDIRKLYGYDSSLLAATQRSDWLAENTEPRLPATNASVDRVEERIRAILNGRCQPAR